MTHITAEELLQDKSMLQTYNEWRNSEFTKLMLSVVEDESRPIFLPTNVYNTELYAALYAQQAGVAWALNRLMTLDEDRTQKLNDIESDYGSSEMLKQENENAARE
jgi:hypothetical protein